MSHTYRFVATTVTSGPRTTRWSVEAKAFAVKAKRDGKTAVEAFAMTADHFAVELKPSYKKTGGAHSHLVRFRRELKQAIANPAHKNHSKAVAACAALGIFQEETADK